MSTTEIPVEVTKDRDSRQSNAKFYSDRLEEYAVERFDLIMDRSTQWDARFPAERDPYNDHDIDPSDPLKLRGTKIQIKGCLKWIKDNGSRRRGRYRLWLPDHIHLCRENGVYLFFIYDPTRREPVFATRFVRARELDTVAGRITWYDAEHSTKRGRPSDVNHRRIFASAKPEVPADD